MEKILAPFTEEQVEKLKLWQESGFHPFTCCSHDGCDRLKQPNEGELIPTTEGWICPCGKWKQNWCHGFMLEDKYHTLRKSGLTSEDIDNAINGDQD